MKTKLFLLASLFIAQHSISQVGVGTTSPESSAMLDVSASDKGILFPRLTTVQRNAVAAPVKGLHVFDITTNSLWFYDGANWINYAAQAKLGDVKSGIQTVDHEGWIKLDGRLISTLSSSQQTAATTMGLSGNLPNASDAYLVQNGGGMGAVSGSNTTTLTQANLPTVNFTGTAASAGDHAHVTDPINTATSTNGDHAHYTDPAALWTSTNGNHTHGHNAPGGYGNYGLALSNYNNTVQSTDGSPNELNVWTNPAGLAIYANGDHAHTVDIPSTLSTTNGAHAHTVDIAATTSTTAGAHSHTVNVSSGGSATPINIAPKSLSVNMFIYLGY
ncbi:MAG: hypothetical protein WC044_12480 [Crocinitomicaceae bacterium]